MSNLILLKRTRKRAQYIEDTIKGEGISNLKFNAILSKKIKIYHYVYEFRSVANSMERTTNCVGKKSRIFFIVGI